MRPTTSDFNRTTVPGDRRTEQIFDGTAPWALEQLAASLDSNLTGPTDRWFNIGIEDENDDMSDSELLWCETVSDLIFKEYARPEVNLNPMLHEVYQDIGAFGTAVLYQDWDFSERHVFFRSFPLADCYILEGAKGRIDALWRKTKMTIRQIKQEFSKPTDNLPPKLLRDLEDYKEMTVIHEVRPRTDEEGYKPGPGIKNKPWSSKYIITEMVDEAPLRESGFSEFPYHVPRWAKLSGEPYGRSPGMVCLPDIKMLNTMAKIIIRAAQKVIDPPLIVPDDGFMLPLKTSPGSLIFKTAGQEDTIEPLKTGGNIEIGNDLLDSRRDQILKAFYVDWIIRQKKKERQTAVEVNDDRNEMLRQMAPMLGRTQVELLSPMLVRTYNLMNAAGRLPIAPATMSKKRLAIYYISPAAKAQAGTKSQAIQIFTQDLVAIAQAMPEVMDAIDPDEYASEMAKYRDVTRKILRSPEQIQQVRQARQKQQAAQQMAATGKDSASALQSLSVAQKNGLPLGGAGQ